MTPSATRSEKTVAAFALACLAVSSAVFIGKEISPDGGRDAAAIRAEWTAVAAEHPEPAAQLTRFYAAAAADRAVRNAGRQPEIGPFPPSEPPWDPLTRDPQDVPWTEQMLIELATEAGPRPDWMPPPGSVPFFDDRTQLTIEAARRGILPTDRVPPEAGLIVELRRDGLLRAGTKLGPDGRGGPFIIYTLAPRTADASERTLAVDAIAETLHELVRAHTPPAAPVLVQPFMLLSVQTWTLGYEWLAEVDDSFDAGLVEVEATR